MLIDGQIPTETQELVDAMTFVASRREVRYVVLVEAKSFYEVPCSQESSSCDPRSFHSSRALCASGNHATIVLPRSRKLKGFRANRFFRAQEGSETGNAFLHACPHEGSCITPADHLGLALGTPSQKHSNVAYSCRQTIRRETL